MKAQGERMLTVRQAAERLGTHQDTIRRWLRSGKIRGKMPGGTKLGYRIPESEITRLLPTPAEDLAERQRLAA
jgi:excisionase family DNA binding protein